MRQLNWRCQTTIAPREPDNAAAAATTDADDDRTTDADMLYGCCRRNYTRDNGFQEYRQVAHVSSGLSRQTVLAGIELG